MLSLYYIIYVLAWLVGITRSAVGVGRALRTGVRVTVTSFLCLVVFSAVISGIQMGGLIFAAIPMFILVPVFLIGIGLTVSATAKTSYLKGLKVAAFIGGALSLIAPFLVILVFWMNQQTNDEQRRNALARFQAGNLVGIMSVQVVGIPASPQLETIHNCQGDQRCYTKFRKNGDTLQNLGSDMAEDIIFEKIELNPIHETCEGNTAPINDCLRISELQQWCEERAELSQSIWCQGRPRHRLVFSASDEDVSRRFDEQQWAEVASENLGTDFVGMPIAIECYAARDSTILSNSHLSRYCRIRYNVSERVVATIFLDKFGASEMEFQTASMLRYTNEIWQIITQ